MVAASGCGKYSISNLRAIKAFQDAGTLYKKNDFKGAAARYEDVIKLGPERGLLGFAYFFLGNSYDNQYKIAKKGEAENDALLIKAVENYRLAIDTLKDQPDPKEIRKLSFRYLIAAYGTDRLNDLDKAEPIAQELIAMEPDEPINYQALASLYEQAGRLDEAEKYFKMAVDKRPKDGATYSALAGYYNRQGNAFEKVISAFDGRAAVEPNNPEAWHTMATYLWEKAWKPDAKLPASKRTEYIDKALVYEDKALAINNEYAEALTYKNILLRLKANYVKDPAVQKQLIKEADDLKARGEALFEKQKKLQAEAEKASAGRKGGGK
jgi:tetratricopeptide (TPR) repeat protein